MPTDRTSFHLRIENQLLADLRMAAFANKKSMTVIINDAISAHLPAMLSDVSPALMDVMALRGDG